MREILNNKFMMVAAITNELSKPSGGKLNYSYDEVVFDVSNSVSSYINNANLDRRVIAVGAEPRIHIWDLLSSNIDGWKDHTYIASGIYAQMLAKIKEPSSSLIFEPDRHFELVAVLNELGSSISFINNECLFMFESFVRDAASYPFSFDYTTIDMDDLESPPEGLGFDFISVSMLDLINDFDIIDQCAQILNPGGIIYITYANESGRLYSQDYYVEPLVNVYEKIFNLEGITTYHMSNSVGFQILIKD